MKTCEISSAIVSCSVGVSAPTGVGAQAFRKREKAVNAFKACHLIGKTTGSRIDRSRQRSVSKPTGKVYGIQFSDLFAERGPDPKAAIFASDPVDPKTNDSSAKMSWVRLRKAPGFAAVIAFPASCNMEGARN